MAIAVQTDPHEIQELKEIFQELDDNGDGFISFDELQKGLGKRENGEALMSILRAADTDGNGTINYTEFLAATMEQQTFMKEAYLRQAFNMFDSDGSGAIDAAEVGKILQGDSFKDVYNEK